MFALEGASALCTLRSSGSHRTTTTLINRSISLNPKPSNPKPLLLRPGPGQGCKWGRSSPRTTSFFRASAGMLKDLIVVVGPFSTRLRNSFTWQFPWDLLPPSENLCGKKAYYSLLVLILLLLFLLLFVLLLTCCYCYCYYYYDDGLLPQLCPDPAAKPLRSSDIDFSAWVLGSGHQGFRDTSRQCRSN